MIAAENEIPTGSSPPPARISLVLVAGGLIAALGSLTLLGWALGEPRLTSFSSHLIPMAPSSAALFLLFSGAIYLRAWPTANPRLQWLSGCQVAVIAVVACGLFVLASRNIHWNGEQLGFKISATLDGVPVGHMSPVSALCFLCASLSFLVSLAPQSSPAWRRWLAVGSASVVLATSFVFLLGYSFGVPLLYGSPLIPPALNTILAFAALGLATLLLAGRPEKSSAPASALPSFWLTSVILAGLGIIAGSYFYYRSSEQHFRQNAEQELLSICELKTAELAQWHRERLGDGHVFFKNPAFAALVRRALASPADETAPLQLKTWIGKCQVAYGYDYWRLLDPQGVTRLSSQAEPPPLSASDVQSVATDLLSDRTNLLDFYRDDSDHRIYLKIEVPIFEDTADQRPLGVLLLRMDPATFLYPYIQRWPTPSESGETLLVRRAGAEVLYLNALRFRPDAALNLRTPLEKTASPAVQAALGQTGILQGVDYRGVPVLAAALPVPDTPWLLEAKIDLAEIDAPLRERMWATILLTGILLGGAGAGAGLWWQRQRASHLQQQLAAAAALRESHELFSLYLRHSPILTYIKTVTPTESRMLLTSDHYQQVFGLSSAEITGKTMAEIFPPEFAAKITADDWAVVMSGKVLKQDQHFNGRIYTTIKFPLTQGGKTLLAGYAIDITDRLTSANDLRLRSAALEAAANAIVITDSAGTIIWANSAFTTLSGWPLAEALGKNPRDLVKSGEHEPAFYRQMWDTILAGNVWRGEIINRRKDGVLRTESMTITPLRDEPGKISHFIAIKQDITDHKTMEAHLLQAQRMEAIGTLASGVAHDLNNILTPVTIVTGILKQKLTSDADRDLLNMAQTSLQRGADIVKQLLAFSRGQDGELAIVQPRHLLNEMLRLMRETFPREIDLRQQVPADLWTVNADPTQLHQVLLNLCVNARDAMPRGGCLTLTAANTTLVSGDPKLPPHTLPGDFVAIAISDTGHGILPEIRHRIFDPFFTTKPIGKGTGLGLSTTLGIVQHHGGFIDLVSTVSDGSTFTVYLPAIVEDEAVPAKIPAAPAQPVLGGQTILVVDDEREVRDSARVLLEGQKYGVVTAVHGEDALAQYLRHRDKISLVLTDLMMPVMSGATLVRALRGIDPALKIVVMTGLTEEQSLVDLAVPDVLMKPFEGPVLLEMVHRLLTGR